MKFTNRFLNCALLLALLAGGGCLCSRELQPELRMVAGEAGVSDIDFIVHRGGVFPKGYYLAYAVSSDMDTLVKALQSIRAFEVVIQMECAPGPDLISRFVETLTASGIAVRELWYAPDASPWVPTNALANTFELSHVPGSRKPPCVHLLVAGLKEPAQPYVSIYLGGDLSHVIRWLVANGISEVAFQSTRKLPSAEKVRARFDSAGIKLTALSIPSSAPVLRTDGPDESEFEVFLECVMRNHGKPSFQPRSASELRRILEDLQPGQRAHFITIGRTGEIEAGGRDLDAERRADLPNCRFYVWVTTKSPRK